MSLPNELIRRIFELAAQRLKDDGFKLARIVNMLDNFSRVCRRWHTIALPMLYSDIEITDLNGLILVVEAFRLHNPAYTQLVQRFNYHSPSHVEPPSLLCKRLLGCSFPALKILELDVGFTSCLDLLPALPAMPVLRSLEIDGEELPMLGGTTFAVLEKLSLKNFVTAVEEEDLSAYPRFPSMNHLLIQMVEGNYEVYRWIEQAISGASLKKLSVRFFGIAPEGDEHVQTWPDLVEILPHNNIEEIQMHVVPARLYCESPEYFEDPLEAFGRLRKLSVTGTYSSFGTLVRLPQTLESLKIYFAAIKISEDFYPFRRVTVSRGIPMSGNAARHQNSKRQPSRG